MNDDIEAGGRDRGGFLTGLIIGAALGAGVALLLAPASGEDTRRLIRRRAKGIQRQAAAAWVVEREAARKALRRRKKELRERLDGAAEQASEVLENVKERLRT